MISESFALKISPNPSFPKRGTVVETEDDQTLNPFLCRSSPFEKGGQEGDLAEYFLTR